MLTINGEEIPDEVVEGEFSQIKGHYERMLQVACCERDPEFRGYAKENIVGRVLLNQAAAKDDAEVSDEEISERLATMVEEAGGEDRFYVQMGMPYKDEDLVKENLKASLKVEKFVDGNYEDTPAPTEEELRACYEQNADRFKTAEEVRASHITKNLSGSESRTEVYDQLRAARTQLRSGEADFDELAAELNDNAEQEIDLGFFKRGEFMEEFETLTFSMEIGEISPVFSTHLGLHLCTVTDRKPAEPIPFEEVEDHVLALHESLLREDRVGALIEDLKKSATITDDDPEETYDPNAAAREEEE